MYFSGILTFLFIFTTQAIAGTESYCQKAITKHLDEAIIHNNNVSQRYNKLSKGRSLPLNTSLITIEKISKLVVKKMEDESAIYRVNGIPLLCEELGDMKEVPSFEDYLPLNLRPQKYLKYDYELISKKLKLLMKENKFDEAYEATANELIKLEDYPHQKCLTRHFLESIANTLRLSHQHRLQAQKLGLPDPINVIKKFISIQRESLFLTNFLDHKAFPLQHEGIMIYCQDIPPIHWK